jgi:dCMP deaminase
MFDWGELAFTSKKPLRELKAVFIAAPRKMSKERFTQLVKELLPHGNIIVGIAKELYVEGFEGQPQFETLQLADIQQIIEKIRKSGSRYHVSTLHYFQRELSYIIEKITFKEVVLINGSWARTFHTRPEFYELIKQKIPYRLVSPFASEDEAKRYAHDFDETLPLTKDLLNTHEMLAVAAAVSRKSFDYSFQTGVVLGKKRAKGYELLEAAFNKVVPYQTYAMHHGASRETFFSPPNDISHYDAIHAEVALILQAQKSGTNLKGTTLFINLLPCPSCARMFTQTDIEEFIYQQDHSDGYAVKLLELAGKKVTRVI